jgi:nucleotide-binding universal stress UspA family protein
MATAARATRLEAGRRIFTSIVVGIDGSQQALEAARQAALLQDVDGCLTLFSAWEIAPRIIGGTGSEIPSYFDADLQRTAAEKALAAASDYVAPYSAATSMLVRRTPVAALLEEIARSDHTLVAVASSGIGRLLGIVEGSVATAIIHSAFCSVLVARPAGDAFPRHVVVGVDGSVESAAAHAAAGYVADRFGAALHAIVARGGKGVDDRLVAAITGGDHDDRPEAPAEALAAAAADADLLVVGSRGLHGLCALGSVSERVAHRAPCSTLVVRRPAGQRALGIDGRPGEIA